MHPVLAKKNVWLIIIGGTIGNLTEWYNVLLYGFLASVMSQLFFPSKNHLLSLTLVYSVFALTFFARPLGGLIFGWIGDVYGRQRALIISLILMALPSFLIGCLPSYDSIGIASPILLCIFRLLQGLSAGGEHTGSAVYMAEHASPASRSFWVSTVPTSAALGILISSLAALLIVSSFSNDVLLAWGWRTGYWAGTLLCIISILLRLNMPETPKFQQAQKKPHKRYSIYTLIKDKTIFKNMLIVFSLASSWGIFYQVLFVWMPTFLTRVLHFNHSLALQINSLYLFIFANLVLLFGYLADYTSRQLLLTIACIAMFMLAYPLFSLLASATVWKLYVAMAIFTIIFSIYLPSAFVCMVESFHVNERYTAFSFSFNTGLALFGGTCPLIVTWLIETTHNTISPAYYMMAAALCALLTGFKLQDKRGQEI